MSEMTKSMRIRQFIELASAAKTDRDKAACQTYFIEEIVSSAPDAHSDARSRFMTAFSDVVSQIDQNRLQVPQTYDQLMDRIPGEAGVRHAIRKVALGMGITSAPGWN